MKSFAFEFGQAVKLEMSDETGKVIGRSEYPASENSYYVVYKDVKGGHSTAWFNESQLVAV